MVLSGNGARLATDSGRRILAWDAATGKALNPDQPRPENEKGKKEGPGHSSWSSLAFAPDGKTLGRVEMSGNQIPGQIGSKYRAQLTFLDAANGRRLGMAVPAATVARAASVAFYSPDGKVLAWRQDCDVHLIDPATGRELRAFPVSKQNRYELMSFAADRRTLLTLGYDRVLHVWDTSTGKELHEFGTPKVHSGHWTRPGSDNPLTLAVSPDGKLAALGDENIVRLVDLMTGKEVPSPGHTSPVLLVQYASDGKSVTSWGVDGTFRVWEAQSGKELRSTKAVEFGDYFALSPDGRTLALPHRDTIVSLRDAATGKELHQVQMPHNPFGTIAFSPDGKTLAVQGLAGNHLELVLCDVASGRVQQRISVIVPPPADGQKRLPPSQVAGPTFAPDGKTLAALISAETLGLWDVATGRELLHIDAPDTWPIQGIVFAPDGRSFALDLGNGLVSLYESATGRERRSFQATGMRRQGQPAERTMPLRPDESAVLYSTRPAAGAAFSPDGRLLAQSLADGTIVIWGVAAKKEAARLTGHRGYAPALAFSPDGKTLASGGRDTTCLIWDVAGLKKTAKPGAVAVDTGAGWTNLASRDAARAYDALCALAVNPAQTVRFLKHHLPPAASTDADKIAKLIADLDSDQFAVRKQASEDLERISDSAGPLLRKALESDPSPEARKRLEELLAKAEGKAPSGEQLRSVRAVEVLETIATPEAIQLLKSLSTGAPNARLTREAKSALDRRKTATDEHR
jgi:WD40 repeat protein